MTSLCVFDCTFGAAGDMTLAALVDAGLDPDILRADLAKLPLEGWSITFEEVRRGSFRATYANVSVPEDDSAHRTRADILSIIEQADLPEPVVTFALAAFDCLFEAEARVHGKTVEEIHLHEAGAADAIIDIVGAAIGLHRLGITDCRSTPVTVGSGTVQAAHGTLPVPAPATLEILKGVSIRGGDCEAELCTPTGAAILRTACGHAFGPLPDMTPERIGYGAGTKDFEGHANVLRLIIGKAGAGTGSPTEGVVHLATTIDDATAEAVAWAADKVRESGALDAWIVPVVMKGGRPGVILECLVRDGDVETVENVLLRETSTFGVRRQRVDRTALERQIVDVETEFGTVRCKVGRFKGRVVRAIPEDSDCRAIAEERNISRNDVYSAATEAARSLLESWPT